MARFNCSSISMIVRIKHTWRLDLRRFKDTHIRSSNMNTRQAEEISQGRTKGLTGLQFK